MNNPILSIVTGTRNRPDSLRRLVTSIVQYTPMSWELIVADASDEPCNAFNFPENVIVLPERPRLGCTAGYNRAFAHASGEYVLWLNDDCEVLFGYAASAIAFMESHPEIGLGALYYKEGYQDFHVNSYFSMTYANFGIVHRAFLLEIDGWDEDFPMYGSDNSFAFKVLLAGKGIAGIPDARVIHHCIHDVHRAENNDLQARYRDADKLVAKYGRFVPQMQETYRRILKSKEEANDQTPDWMRAKLEA